MRVRFAPSPTGELHLGGLRTALFNYLLARRSGGQLILRIEDTDRARNIPGAMESIIKTLEWAGIKYDEGPGRSPDTNYIQSSRLDIYHRHAQHLLAKRLAYKCYCPKERQPDGGSNKAPEKYSKRCRFTAQNSSGPFVVRLAAPLDQAKRKWTDGVYGDIEYSTIDDIVLMKTDGFPTYHFANVVDDHEMRIDLVLRGQEWLPSTPIHHYLYKAFDWKMPSFCHLPLLKNPDHSKLSKRQNSAHVNHYRQKGFLPDALVNYVAFLGWTPSVHYGNREILSMSEMIAAFDTREINKADAIVDLRRLEWFNRKHLERSCAPMDLVNELAPLVPPTFSRDYLGEVVNVVKGRISNIREIPQFHGYFFKDPTVDWSSLVTDSSSEFLLKFWQELAAVENWTKEEISLALSRTKGNASDRNLAKSNMLVARMLITGVEVGAPLTDTIALLGKEVTLRRISKIGKFQYKGQK